MVEKADNLQIKTVDAAQLARFLQVSVQKIGVMASQGQVAKVKAGKYDFYASVQKIILDQRSLLERGGATADAVEKKRETDILLTEAKTRQINLNMAASEGVLVLASDVQIEHTQINRQMALTISSYPDELERKGRIDRYQVELQRELCDHLSQKIYDDIREYLSRKQSYVSHADTIPVAGVAKAAKKGKSKRSSENADD
jgi:phage terminase Nu1 subunit (DNA packaging protein)